MASNTTTVACPNCGKAGTYTIRNTDGKQAEGCRHCGRNFYIDLRGGQVTGVSKA